MPDNKKTKVGQFSNLDRPRVGNRPPVTDMATMALEFMKYQSEVAYETAKRHAVAMTSSASTIGFGWSAFFFGIYQESWLTSSIGLMLVFVGMFFLAYWTPRILGKLRAGLDDLGAKMIYDKWLADPSKSETAEKEHLSG
jgi:hypothetical protein